MSVDPRKLINAVQKLNLGDIFTNPQYWTTAYGNVDKDEHPSDVGMGLDGDRVWFKFKCMEGENLCEINASEQMGGRKDQVQFSMPPGNYQTANPAQVSIRVSPRLGDLAVIIKCSFNYSDQSKFFRFDGNFPWQKVAPLVGLLF